jgi:hypothetical protein
VNKLYKDTRAAFVDDRDRGYVISKGAAGRIAESQRGFWATVLFTRLLGTAYSITRMAPRTHPIPERNAHWDPSAVAALTRILSECYLVFYYLCVDDIDEDEWLTRLNLIQLVDNESRKHLLLQPGAEDKDGYYQSHRDDLTQRLKAKKFFSSLPERRQLDLLKGEKMMYLTQDELLTRMGENRSEFRRAYRYFSAHVHSAPIAFLRMPDDERGNGLENEADKTLMIIALGVGEKFLSIAITDMLAFFPDAEERGARLLTNVPKEKRDPFHRR